MRTKILTALFFSALLAGCASGVKLDEVPVEDRSATSAGANVQAQPIGSAAQTSVSNVISEKSSNGIGPVGVEHVVFFDYDSFVVRADARPVIENHARFLQANKQRKANLEGHTDERGGREYNLALGQKRAEAVRQALTLLGVSDAQLEAVSYGKEKPAAQGSAETDLAKNRRVEIRY
ncbi:peptidoglycan-associated lipoprotein Pal [Limnohabitans sp. WS1]|jgi:peptidoglycan-associated lipoprotein|uniref:peptidoglycan-associated lipoprotein Pal n=1 Tax=Limnohabitans sp. WS1 TaxID=1100726 RepID=UPI000D3AFE55|nr:peptidoglycan-associated lipoprotein Pal [Limnohabitans sp. WS1]PUE15525.1 peptidoglycan-associated lipoprotein [Limnohabitans sp. WS1]